LRDLPKPPKIYETAKIVKQCEQVIDDDTFIGDFVFIAVAKLVLRRGAQVNSHTSITGGSGTVWIGENAVVSYGVRIMTRSDTPTGEHMNDASAESTRAIRVGDIIIGAGAFVGANSVIMPGVTIGKRAVIGAGTYVCRDVPPDTVVYPEQRLIMKARKRF
jgi:acetyltransferase-like isoleucine patch superfamily enzyme